MIERYIDYFREKNRLRRFRDLEIDDYNEETITVGLMSAVCRLKACSFEKSVRAVLTAEMLEELPPETLLDCDAFAVVDNILESGKVFRYRATPP